MNNVKTKDLIGRMFGYRLDDGDSTGPLPILAEVLPSPRGFDLGADAVWCRCYSEMAPDGEEGSVAVAWLVGEISPALIFAMRHIHEDNPEAVKKLADRFPIVSYRPTFEAA
jgi:hypothetical protein